MIERETPGHILQRASWTHFYVAEDDSKIIGCGAIGPYWDGQDESSLFTIFVHPDFQEKGVGKAIVETLERDEFALRAKRIEIPASITGLPFYQKMGDSFKDGITELDEERLYRLEKCRKTIIRVVFANVKGNILPLLAVFFKLFLPSKKVTIGIFTGWYYFHHIVNTLSAFANFFLPT